MADVSVQEARPPHLLHAFDYAEWSYYLHGHDEAELVYVDEPERLEWARVWMRPIALSALDESERPDDYEPVSRDQKGRFTTAYAWMECSEATPGAEPYLAVRYKR